MKLISLILLAVMLTACSNKKSQSDDRLRVICYQGDKVYSNEVVYSVKFTPSSDKSEDVDAARVSRGGKSRLSDRCTVEAE